MIRKLWRQGNGFFCLDLLDSRRQDAILTVEVAGFLCVHGSQTNRPGKLGRELERDKIDVVSVSGIPNSLRHSGCLGAIFNRLLTVGLDDLAARPQLVAPTAPVLESSRVFRDSALGSPRNEHRRRVTARLDSGSCSTS